MFEKSSIVTMYAVTPCHAGSGSSVGVVDLPIQRERHTNYPIIQSSGVKGAFRANFANYKEIRFSEEEKKEDQFGNLENLIFGSSDNSNAYMGAISVSDAKILAFPMRSNVAPFVWITCPAVLKRFVRDLKMLGRPADVDLKNINVDDNDKCQQIFGDFSEKPILLEDISVKKTSIADSKLIGIIREYFCNDSYSVDRVLLVSDRVFDYGVTKCTEIAAQIRINQEKGTTEDGSLRYQENLPADTLMYVVVNWGELHCQESDRKLEISTISAYVKRVISTHIQIAGNETCGQGIFAIEWNDGERGLI